MPEPDAAGSAAGRRLLNATAIMASGTLVSRILGFVKATLLVIVLGATSPLADAYSLATLVPNSLYMIFAGGALNTVLVPQIVRHTKNDADGGVAIDDVRRDDGNLVDRADLERADRIRRQSRHGIAPTKRAPAAPGSGDPARTRRESVSRESGA